jgi:hypothetical protein
MRLTGNYRIYERTDIDWEVKYRLQYQVKFLCFYYWSWYCFWLRDGTAFIIDFDEIKDATNAFVSFYKEQDKRPFTFHSEGRI